MADDLFPAADRAADSYSAASIEVLEGLEPGEQVIARAGAFFSDGDRVRVAP